MGEYTKYKFTQNDWDGVEIVDAQSNLTVASVSMCTPEFLGESLAAPRLLATLKQLKTLLLASRSANQIDIPGAVASIDAAILAAAPIETTENSGNEG